MLSLDEVLPTAVIRGGLSDAAFALGLASSLGGKRIAFDRFVLIEDNVEIFGLA